MSYSEKSFWDKYKDYVEECFPRHSRVIEMMLGFERPEYLVDLGCGGCKEAKDLLSPSLYFGIDSVVDQAGDGMLADYRKDFWQIVDSLPFPPDAFTSIFSSEVTAPQDTNYFLYDRMFRTFPSIKYGIVSGFYYGRQRERVTVQEAGGLESYQSILDLAEIRSLKFTETRILIPGPSTLFGDDVIEVWKLLERKSND